MPERNTPINIPVSALQRLSNRAHAMGENNNLVLSPYTMERIASGLQPGSK